MSHPGDRPIQPLIEPETDQERELLEIYRDLDEVDRVLVWAAILTELGRRSEPVLDEGPAEGVEENHPPHPSAGLMG